MGGMIIFISRAETEERRGAELGRERNLNGWRRGVMFFFEFFRGNTG